MRTKEMRSNLVLSKKEKGIGLITINRPEVYNALNHELLIELSNVLREIKSDSEIEVIIITGAGEKAFVSGADINELSAMNSSISGFNTSREHQFVFNQIEHLGKPSIAAINGYCLGGGLELALACTLRIASERAVLGFPELSLGIVPAYGGTQRLPRLVGKGKTAEMILTAKPIDAQEAFRIGLVNQVVSAQELIPKTKEMAEAILKNGSTAIRLAMDLILRGTDMSLDNSLVFESVLASLSIKSSEANQKLKAFLEKKK
jgi:enoyl-CoA hydratase